MCGVRIGSGCYPSTRITRTTHPPSHVMGFRMLALDQVCWSDNILCGGRQFTDVSFKRRSQMIIASSDHRLGISSNSRVYFATITNLVSSIGKPYRRRFAAIAFHSQDLDCDDHSTNCSHTVGQRVEVDLFHFLLLLVVKSSLPDPFTNRSV